MVITNRFPVLLVIALTTAPALAEAPGPIQVIIDLHCDPMDGDIPIQLVQYENRRDAIDWALGICEPYGARLSFLSTGQFMEWVLGDSLYGHPVIERLHLSGGMVGTHSHQRWRIDLHVWEEMPPEPTREQLEQQWQDHKDVVDAVIETVLGVTDPDAIMTINCARGAHVVDDALRLEMMEDWGYTIHQQGPEEVFYADFDHYVWNAYRPDVSNFLVHDPDGPVTLSPFGPILGRLGPHFGIVQDMRVAGVQGRFLMELLNWLDDVHVAQTGRVWTMGWASHAYDLAPGGDSRDSLEPMLEWLDEHFVGTPVGGAIAARFSTMINSREALVAWEAEHPGESPFAFDPDGDPIDSYPYLLPVWRYLTGAQYESAEPSVDDVRWHRVAGAAGPRWVLYTTTGTPVRVDLSAHMPPGPLAAVNPRSGRFVIVPPADVPVQTTGTILAPAPQGIIFDWFADVDGDGTVGFPDLLLVLSEWGPCSGDPWPGVCTADLDGNGLVGFPDLLIVLAHWT